MEVTLQLDDELAARLDELAADYGIDPAELIRVWIRCTRTEREYREADRKAEESYRTLPPGEEFSNDYYAKLARGEITEGDK